MPTFVEEERVLPDIVNFETDEIKRAAHVANILHQAANNRDSVALADKLHGFASALVDGALEQIGADEEIIISVDESLSDVFTITLADQNTFVPIDGPEIPDELAGWEAY
jgi:hypothetical protein